MLPLLCTARSLKLVVKRCLTAIFALLRCALYLCSDDAVRAALHGVLHQHLDHPGHGLRQAGVATHSRCANPTTNSIPNPAHSFMLTLSNKPRS